jgi:hypothetical protein
MWSPAPDHRGPPFATVFEDEPLESGAEADFGENWSSAPRNGSLYNRASSLGLSSRPLSTALSTRSSQRSAVPPRGPRPLTQNSVKRRSQHPFAVKRSTTPNDPRDSVYQHQYRMSEDGSALQVSLLSPEDEHDADECVVCCESLGANFRLPGEKPPIVPECGHAIHEVSRWYRLN